MYVEFLYHCYIDAEVDNKETFNKEFVWDLFRAFLVDMEKVCTHACVLLCTYVWVKSATYFVV